MENEQNKDQKNDPKDQARNLFFETALTQAQIAELIGVSQKTISLWMNEGKWKMLKDTAEKTPAVLIEQMTNELSEIHNNIASREPGKRFATSLEAEIRRKIVVSIRCIQEQQTRGAHAEVMMNFINYVKRRSSKDVKLIVTYADEYINGEVQLGQKQPFVPYTLPGQPQTSGATDNPPSDKPGTTIPPPHDKNNPGSINEAA